MSDSQAAVFNICLLIVLPVGTSLAMMVLSLWHRSKRWAVPVFMIGALLLLSWALCLATMIINDPFKVRHGTH